MWVVGRRGVLDIYESIISNLSEGPLKKTHLTYKANLDTRLATKYVQALINLKLVTKSTDDESYFVLTKKGQDFLKQYRELIKFVNLNA